MKEGYGHYFSARQTSMQLIGHGMRVWQRGSGLSASVWPMVIDRGFANVNFSLLVHSNYCYLSLTLFFFLHKRDCIKEKINKSSYEIKAKVETWIIEFNRWVQWPSSLD